MKEYHLKVPEELAFDNDKLHSFAENFTSGKGYKYYLIKKRSIDARKNVIINLWIQCSQKPFLKLWNSNSFKKQLKGEIIIVGSGPAGLFGALRALELGLKPIILERGKDVRSRRRDIAAINRKGIVNEDSNYCFGEGGAGTYSDGKLYTRSKKRGDIQKILEMLHFYGAREEILFDAHPHIGTNKLPGIITAIREGIINQGGEVHFDSKVVDLIIEQDKLIGVITADGKKYMGDSVILATGHSATDIFKLLHKRNIKIEQKPFAIGVRIEHDQHMIDRAQYHRKTGAGEYLPPAYYSLSHQANINGEKRGVFSFCMCPGGFIVPSATEEQGVVVNGMSPSRRNGKYANSGIVVEVRKEDTIDFEKEGPLAGLAFQRYIESKALKLSGGHQKAPAQKVGDFIRKKVSKELNKTSYQPGLKSVDLNDIFPHEISESLRQGLISFNKKINGFTGQGGQIVGVESRTSSPVKIPRSKETFEHPELKRFFPAGEGAGYAGGIISAAMDGMNCIDAAYKIYWKENLQL